MLPASCWFYCSLFQGTQKFIRVCLFALRLSLQTKSLQTKSLQTPDTCLKQGETGIQHLSKSDWRERDGGERWCPSQPSASAPADINRNCDAWHWESTAKFANMALPVRIPCYTTGAQKLHQKNFTAKIISANESECKSEFDLLRVSQKR